MAHRIQDLLAYYVYALYRDLECTRIFYIGKGKGRRWQMHEAFARHNCDHHRCRIVRQLVKQFGEVPKRKLGERLSNAEACALEVALIAKHGREPDGPLINQTPGGDDGIGHPSDATRAKMSASHKGVKLPPERVEHLRRLAAARRGVPRSPEVKRKISDIQILRWGRATNERKIHQITAMLANRRPRGPDRVPGSRRPFNNKTIAKFRALALAQRELPNSPLDQTGKRHSGITLAKIRNKLAALKIHDKICGHCAIAYKGRVHQRWCSPRCRVAACKAKKRKINGINRRY